MKRLRQLAPSTKVSRPLSTLLITMSSVVVLNANGGFAAEDAATRQNLGSTQILNTFSVRPTSGALTDSLERQIAKPDTGVTVLAAAPKLQEQELGSIASNSPGETASDADDVSVNMSNAQRVRIRTNGAPEVAGEYIINNGTISMPLIGRLNVRDKKLAGLEELISAKLSRALRRDIQASIEIDRYMPFYIVGGVATAGEQEWRQGMTVIQAIAGSGGIVKQAGRGGDAAGAVVKLRFALAQLERLRAERDNTPNWQPSQRLIELERSSSQLANWSSTDFSSRQRKMLERQLADTRSVIEGLERERDAAQLEVKSNEKQIEVVSEQLAIATQLSEVGSKLRDKQLVANSQFLHQRIELLRANVTTIEAKSGIARAHAKIAALNRQIARVAQERNSVVAEKIESLERDVAEFELQTGKVASDPTTSRGTRYAIARKTNNTPTTSSADLFTEVLPGDVIIVSESSEESTDLSDLRSRASTELGAVRQRTQRFLDHAAVAPAPIGRAGAGRGQATATTATH